MRWQGHRQSENVEDRRPEDVTVPHPALGSMVVTREKDTKAVISLTPVELNEKCAKEIKDVQTTQTLGRSALSESFIKATQPRPVEPKAPNSCGTKIRDFFKFAADSNLIPHFVDADVTGNDTAPTVKAVSPMYTPVFWKR